MYEDIDLKWQSQVCVVFQKEQTEKKKCLKKVSKIYWGLILD